MKLAILGGEGFIGTNIIEYLYTKEECYSYDLVVSPFLRNKQRVYIKSDLHQQPPRIEADVVIHLLDNNWAPLARYIAAEKQLIRAAFSIVPKHVVVMSSAAIYSNPDSPYGMRKQALETLYADYCHAHNIPLAIIRLFNVYGPYQIPYKPGSLIANIFCDFLRNQETEIYDLHTTRDFVFSRDIGRFIEEIIDTRFQGVTDLGTGRQTSIATLITLIEHTVTKQPLSIRGLGKKENLTTPDVKNTLANTVFLTPLQIGLEETFKFYIQNFDQLPYEQS